MPKVFEEVGNRKIAEFDWANTQGIKVAYKGE